jgi:hypothetical protein
MLKNQFINYLRGDQDVITNLTTKDKATGRGDIIMQEVTLGIFIFCIICAR